jgi:hypothetical protein
LPISIIQNLYESYIFDLNKIPIIFTRTDPLHELDLPPNFEHFHIHQISSTKQFRKLIQNKEVIALSCYSESYQPAKHRQLVDLLDKFS